MTTEKITASQERELTGEQLEGLLEVRVSDGVKLSEIARNVRSGAALRFIVAAGFDIIIAPGSRTHDGMLEDNNLEWKDCWITNGFLAEKDDGSLEFIYHTATREPAHRIVEKKILDFLDDRIDVKLGAKKTSSTYSTD